MKWRVCLDVQYVCVHPLDSQFTVVAKKHRRKQGRFLQVVAEFNANSPIPRAIHKGNKRNSNGVIAAAYVKHQGSAELFVLDSSLNLRASREDGSNNGDAAEGTLSAAEEQASALMGELDIEAGGSGAFARVFGGADSVMAAAEDPTGDGVQSMATGSASDITTALFEVPCHVLPPMQTLISQFMQAALGGSAAFNDQEPDAMAGLVADVADDSENEDAGEGAAMDTAVDGAKATASAAAEDDAHVGRNARAARPSDVEFMADFWASAAP